MTYNSFSLSVDFEDNALLIKRITS